MLEGFTGDLCKIEVEPSQIFKLFYNRKIFIFHCHSRKIELNDLFILTYLYCVNGEVKKAEDLVASSGGLIKRDWFVDWLWGKLQADFGFHPPP